MRGAFLVVSASLFGCSDACGSSASREHGGPGAAPAVAVSASKRDERKTITGDVQRFLKAKRMRVDRMGAALTEEQWRSEVKALEGGDVIAVGCLRTLDLSEEGRFTVLVPCDFDVTPRGDNIRWRDEPLSRFLALDVRDLAEDLMGRPVRVLGTFRAARVADGPFTIAWGRIEDPIVELLSP